MTREQLLQKLVLKEFRAVTNSGSDEEPGCYYWHGYTDATHDIYKLVEELDDECPGTRQEASEENN